MNTSAFTSIRSFANILSLTDEDYHLVYKMLAEDIGTFFLVDRDLKIILTYEAFIHFIKTGQLEKCTLLETSIEYIHYFALNKQDELLLGEVIDVRRLNYTFRMLERILTFNEKGGVDSGLIPDNEVEYFSYCFKFLQLAKDKFFKGHLRSAIIVAYEMYLHYFHLGESEKCLIIRESLFCFEP